MPKYLKLEKSSGVDTFENAAPKKDSDKNAQQPSLAQAEIKSRILFLYGAVDKDSSYKLTKSLLLLDELSSEPIKLFINSPGGEVNSGFSIFDCIRFLRSPVYVIGSGLVASAAALIYLAVPATRRFSLPHARYLLHQPLSGMRGVVTDLEIYSKEIEELKSLLNTIISKETGQKMSAVEKDTDRDFWLNSQRALEYGLVGKIFENKEAIKNVFVEPSQNDGKAKNTSTKKAKKTELKKTKPEKTQKSTKKASKPKQKK